jgi:hypothetical protein
VVNADVAIPFGHQQLRRCHGFYPGAFGSGGVLVLQPIGQQHRVRSIASGMSDPSHDRIFFVRAAG